MNFKRCRIYFFFVVLFFSFVLGAPSYAQNTPLPGAADPSRFNEQFNLPVLKQGQQDIKPPIAQDIDETIPDGSDGFVLTAVRWIGVTAFSEEELDAIAEDYLGRTVNLEVLNHLAARITAYYRKQGYFLSRALIPEQEVDGGVVSVQIVEGYISQVILEDPDGLLDKRFSFVTKRILNRIGSLSPLHGPTLERYMLLLNDGAGVTVRSIMATDPSAKQGGAVALTLRAVRQDSSLSLGANNHGSRYVGPWQFENTYGMGGLLAPRDSLGLSTTIAHPLKEVQYGAISYSIPLHEDGLRMQTNLSYSNSEPGSTLRALEAESDSFFFEAGVTYPWLLSRREQLDVGGKFVVRNSATEFLDTELIDDKVRSVVFSAQYARYGDYQGTTQLNFSLHKGLDVLGSRATGEARLSRAQGRSDFVKVKANLTRQQTLSKDFTLIGTVKGQYAPHPLLSSEEFGYGGADFGRAYDPSEITGDKGVVTSLELRHTGVKPPNCLYVLSPFVFYDLGKVWNHDFGVEPVSAASAGLGTYYSFLPKYPLSGALSLAYPLTKPVDHPDMGGEDGPRVLFEVKLTF